MKRINEKGIGDIINVSDVMMKRNFDSLFTKPKTEYSLYDVITELMKKINDNKSSGGRVELEVNDVNEKLAEKANKNELLALSDKVKNHVHYITSDEQIITDYHGYLTRSDEVKTEDPNERRYKYIRAKGYDIHCTVQYDTGKAPEAFSYNDEIYASTFSVKGVLVEPRFTLRVKSKITFEDAIKSKADKVELEAMNKVLKSHKHNISDINELQATLDSKADKNHTHKSFTTVRADDIILNYTLGSSAPLENPSTSVKDTLNSLNSKCMNIEGHVRNFETHELPAMLDKKADKNHTHDFFTTVGIESIEGTVEGTGGEGGAPPHGDALYWKPPNFPQGLTSEENITTMKYIRCRNVYVMEDENNVKFTAQDLYDKKADKNHTHKSFTTVRADDIILNYTLGSSAPLENPSTSVKDTLNSLNSKCMNIEGHARNFETHELPAMLDSKADKTYVDTELTKKFSKPDTMTFTTEIINGEPATPFEFVRGLQPDTFEFFLDNSIELTLHYKSGTNATFHPGDTFQMVFNDISSLEYVYRVMSIYDLIYPIGAVYTSMNPINPNTLFGGRWYEIVDSFPFYTNTQSMKMGGSKKIGIENLPSHMHRFSGRTSVEGNHSHSITKRGYINLAAGSNRQGMNRYDITTDPKDVSTGIFCGTAGNHTHVVAGIT
ncbi:keratin-associated protein family, partial [Trichomonas vaginalis G3]|uniref:keratin-associated protein family n=1 Tax=Trichomonas vaginalis (strain ATCC PRA-98 / G3) TaxID=412133 RepID=UPI0021E5AB88